MDLVIGELTKKYKHVDTYKVEIYSCDHKIKYSNCNYGCDHCSISDNLTETIYVSSDDIDRYKSIIEKLVDEKYKITYFDLNGDEWDVIVK